VCLFHCNIFIGFRIIKEMLGLVGSGTPYINGNVTFPPSFYFTSNETLLVRKFCSFANIIPQQNFQIALWNSVPPQKFVWQ